jgi:hypothetical protein
MKLIYIFLALLIGFLAWGQFTQLKENKALSALLKHQVALNDSTQAILAAERSRRGELEAAKEGAKALGGRLVAGVRIQTRADTVYVPLTDVETVEREGTRYATVEDSTKLGIKIRVDAAAPPYPSPLQLGYNVIVPEFNPEVGFVQVGDQFVAVVSWAGQEFTLEETFFDPRTKRTAGLPKWAVVNENTWGTNRKGSALLVERRLGSKSTLSMGPAITIQPRDDSKTHWNMGWTVNMRSVYWKSKN